MARRHRSIPSRREGGGSPPVGGSLLEEFRRASNRKGRTRPPIPAREWLVMIGLMTLWTVTLWWLGGIEFQVQVVMGVFSLGILGLLFIPLPEHWESPQAPHAPRVNLRRLLRFPPFWLGLFLQVFLLVQYLNPFGREVLFTGYSVVQADLDYVSWLPHGLRTRFDDGANPLTTMAVWWTPWLASCIAWVGLHTRRGVMIFFNFLAVSLLVWVLVAYYQQAAGMDEILGLWQSERTFGLLFWGTIVALTHAGYLMALGIALALALFFQYLAVARRRARLGGPQWVFLVMAVLFSHAIIYVGERGPMFVMVVVWLTFLIALAVYFARAELSRAFILFVPLAAGMAFMGYYLTRNPDVHQRLKVSVEVTAATIEDKKQEPRYFLSMIAWDMFRDRPWYGWGGGSWRYYYNVYAPHYPDFNPVRPFWYKDENGNWKKFWTRFYFRDAHNDYLQTLLELGVVGSAPIVLTGLYWLALLGRNVRHWDAATMCLLMAMAGVLVAGWVEFYFRNLSVSLTLALLTVLIVRRLQLRSQRERRSLADEAAARGELQSSRA